MIKYVNSCIPKRTSEEDKSGHCNHQDACPFYLWPKLSDIVICKHRIDLVLQCKDFKFIYLHLFAELFHGDLSSIVRRNTAPHSPECATISLLIYLSFCNYAIPITWGAILTLKVLYF